jgi:hypothetical protein
MTESSPKQIKIIPNEVSPMMGMYDAGNGESLKTLKIIDVTGLCENEKGDLKTIKYSRTTKGVIFKMGYSSVEDGIDYGTQIFFDLIEGFAESESFRSFAQRHFRIDPGILANVITENSIGTLN